MINLFVDLLQIALGNKSSISRIPSREEWISLLDISQQQAVVGVIVQGLEKLPREQLPPKDILLQWIGLFQISRGTYSLHCERARELTLEFDTAGFRSCVLKGIGLARLYPKPESRQLGDIDLWVDGTRKEVMEWLHTQCKVGTVIWHHVDTEFFEDVPTEIHFHPCWMYNPFCNMRLQKWFDAQKKEQMTVDEKLGFACPSVRFNAVYSLVHFYHHLIEEGIGIRHIIDYYYIIKSLAEANKQGVVGDLKRFGLLRLAEAMMWVLKEVCGMPADYLICDPNEQEGRFLFDEILRGGNFGHYRNDDRRRNSVGRLLALLPHYPQEILWVVPWKLWHRIWMLRHGRR